MPVGPVWQLAPEFLFDLRQVAHRAEHTARETKDVLCTEEQRRTRMPSPFEPEACGKPPRRTQRLVVFDVCAANGNRPHARRQAFQHGRLPGAVLTSEEGHRRVEGQRIKAGNEWKCPGEPFGVRRSAADGGQVHAVWCHSRIDIGIATRRR